MNEGWAILLGAALLAGTCPEAMADGPTVGDLRGQCAGMIRAIDTRDILADEEIGSGVCAGYIAASRDFINMLSIEAKSEERPFAVCLPRSSTAMQGARVFVKWADDHPERHHESRLLGVIGAWIEAFPCE